VSPSIALDIVFFFSRDEPCGLFVGEVKTKYPPGLRTRSTSIRNNPSVGWNQC